MNRKFKVWHGLLHGNMCTIYITLHINLLGVLGESAGNGETWFQSLGQEDPLEKEMAIHSSILAWKMPWTEEPDRLQSMGSQSWIQLND